MPEHGSFSGNPKTEWLVDEYGADRDMKLLEDFFYYDPSGKVWSAPAGSTINGASIPRALWSTVGSPYTDDYRRASIVHDVACKNINIERAAADLMFRQACMAGGCTVEQANILYAGVRLGAWSGLSFPTDICQHLSVRTNFKLSAHEHFMQNIFFDMAEHLSRVSDPNSIEEVNNIIDKFIRIMH